MNEPKRESRQPKRLVERAPRLKAMARNGAAPPNKKKDRNDAVIASIRAGMSAAQVARTLGISRQRVSQIWHSRDGDRTNLHGVKRRKRLAEQLARENASRSVPYGG